jgi:prepilin-type N-terminal cleavage/methylation domain-containing protein
MRKTDQKGFTLIELLVVIAIIGLLSTLAVVALNSARQKARDSKRVADIKQIQTALEMYYLDENGYPVLSAAVLGETATASLCNSTNTPTGFEIVGDCTTPIYMGLVPGAPGPADAPCDDTANEYTYTGTATGYEIAFCLGGGVGDLLEGPTWATHNGMTQTDPSTP